jgi:hypothetical protein
MIWFAGMRPVAVEGDPDPTDMSTKRPRITRRSGAGCQMDDITHHLKWLYDDE